MTVPGTDQSGNATERLFGCSDTDSFASPVITVPSGTLLRCFCRATIVQQTDTADQVDHIVTALRLTEGQIDSGGSPVIPTLDLAEPEAAGYEDLLTMGSGAVGPYVSGRFGQIMLDSKSKRTLVEDDVLSFDLANIPVEHPAEPVDLTFSLDARILINTQ